MDRELNYILPPICTIQRIKQYLDIASPIFGMEHKKIEHVTVDTHLVERMDIVGVLLIYKFVEYTSKKACFKSPEMIGNKNFLYEMQRLGFWELLNSFFLNLPGNYASLKYQLFENVFIAPIRLNEMSLVEVPNNYIPDIQDYYHDTETCSVVFSVLAEIVSNFKEHSNDETDTVLVATGNTNKFEVVCADTGIGMVSSLAPVLNNNPSLRIRNYDVLEMATMQGITSKKGTDHMGFGLWLISEFVKIAKGEIHIYSEGAYYVNQCGKIKKGTCGFWQGTIIYVSLPLNKTNEIRNWQNSLAELYQDIKINCV